MCGETFGSILVHIIRYNQMILWYWLLLLPHCKYNVANRAKGIVSFFVASQIMPTPNALKSAIINNILAMLVRSCLWTLLAKHIQTYTIIWSINQPRSILIDFHSQGSRIGKPRNNWLLQQILDQAIIQVNEQLCHIWGWYTLCNLVRRVTMFHDEEKLKHPLRLI